MNGNDNHLQTNYIYHVASEKDQTNDCFGEDGINCPTSNCRTIDTSYNQPQNPVFQSPNNNETVNPLLALKKKGEKEEHNGNNTNLHHTTTIQNDLEMQMQMEKNMKMSIEQNHMNMDMRVILMH